MSLSGRQSAGLGCGCVAAALLVPGLLLALFVLGPRLLEPEPSEVEPRPAPDPHPPDPLPPSDDYVPAGSLNQFRAAGEGDRLRLTYGFIDHHGRRQRVACTLDRRDHEREVAGFGYDEGAMWRQLDAELAELARAEAERRGVARYYDIQVHGRTAYSWRWEVPGGLGLAEQRRALAAVEDFDRWLERDFRRLGDERIARYYREHGFRLQGDTLAVDYRRLAEEATRPLADCFAALARASSSDSDRRRLGLFLAFFQELRYEIPPDVEAGRQTLGFRVPTAVMARGAGDCDSKSAAFCALWRNLPSRTILILVPGHALVGVEARPGPDEAFVRLGNRYFVLCEVAGPGKIPPGGESSISGNFEYVLIEPAGAG